jgi:carbamoyltransferase
MKKDVVVLGIQDGHNSSAAIIKNGKVAAAVQEERFVNIKNYSGTPIQAIKKIFEIAKINPRDVDLITIGSLVRTHEPLKERPLHVRLYERYAFLFQSHKINDYLIKILSNRRKMNELYNIFKEMNIEKKEIMFIEHHLAHAASTFYQRPWDEKTLVLTLDGAGDGICSTVNIGDKNSIERIASTTAYNSPGNVFYSEITGYLGLKRWEHEYKVMGMAPYGISSYCKKEIEKIIRINPNKPLEFQNTLGAYCIYAQKKLIKLLSGKRFDNISAATQEYFEELVSEWVSNAIKKTGIHTIACAGGMFMNVKANKVLREKDDVDKIFFYPAAGDEGTSIGAALEGYYRFCEREGIKPYKENLGPIYYGMEFDNEYIENVIKNSKWKGKANHIDNIGQEVGSLLAKDAIIGVFHGKMEFGPRALGNRSILSNPMDLKVIRKLNFAIKMRDFWMPFAPSVLTERNAEYFYDSKFAPYMIEAFDSTKEADDIIAGLHPRDRSGRPQVVNEWNENYYSIIKSFENITGVGGVLNTSFNLHGYPIVGTPEIALNTFENSGLDELVLGNWIISK